jgi:membrane fusion protein (multidrug efflux system)
MAFPMSGSIAARIAALLAVVYLGAACSEGGALREDGERSREDRITPVVVAKPEVRSLQDVFLQREATILPPVEPKIATRQEGFVKRYVPEIGDILHEGDLIAELDDANHRLALVELRAARQRAGATLSEEKRAWQRAQELFEQNIISEGDLVARRAAIERARADVAEAGARVERAETDLAELRIVAPIPGVVTEQLAYAGEFLERGDFLAAMKRIDLVFAVCTVNERHIAKIQEGAPALVEVTGFPGRSFEGLVWKVVPDVVVSSRSFPIKVLLPNPDLILTPGMSARVSFIRALDDALLISKDAVLQDGDEHYVLVVERETATRRPVELGVAIEDRWHVRSGLDGSESVIVAGNEDLDAGTAVQVVELPPPGPPTLPDALKADRAAPAGS